MLLEELKPGLRVDGLIPAEVITVVFAQWHGTDALELTYKTNAGVLGQQVIFRKDQDKLAVAQTGSRAFDANASDFKLVAEAQRITLAGLFDPMLAVATSDVRPLPHQIRAVYGELLPLLTVAVDADDVVTGFADGFGGVGQDGDGVVVTVTR